MHFDFEKLKISDIILVKPKVFGDSRGFFMESYKESEFINAGIKERFIQDNHSKSTKGVLRGLHYQLKPFCQAKLVRCTKGKIFDVAVDIRKGSETFGEWVGIELSEENKHILYIPEGFAHGFAVLSEGAELQYKTNNEYSPDNDRGVNWNDPDLNINWGIDFEPIISEKDKLQPNLKDLKDKDLL